MSSMASGAATLRTSGAGLSRHTAESHSSISGTSDMGDSRVVPLQQSVSELQWP